MITVFTPTFNRAYCLNNLYDSLLRQTNKNFVWLIVDDGSTDDTRDKITEWKEKGDLKIEYVFQENKGKSAAHNTAIKLASTELFTCVDSDDYLDDQAIAIVLEEWEKRDFDAIGIIALRSVSAIGKKINKVSRSTLIGTTRKKIIKGDTMLIYRTELLKKHLFPSFPGEKFIPEDYIYDQLDAIGEMIVLNKVLYYGEYLDDGYTNNMSRLIKNNPCGYLLFIEQRILQDKSIFYLFEDYIRYIAISLCKKDKNIIFRSKHKLMACIAFPAGYFLYKKRYR